MGASQRRIAAGEEARCRLARELHDDHCQRVAALALELRVVRNRLAEGDPRRAQLEAAGQQLAELGEDLRRLSHDLHPAILEHRGLIEALRDLCAELARRHGLHVATDLSEVVHPIPREIALGLYRIAQEALANTARHAGAQTAHLALRSRRGTVRLSLADDGAGFPLETAREIGGLGLASMQERARALGGRCRIVSSPGAGTAIEVSVPRRPLGRWLRRRWGWVTAVLILLALAGCLIATMVQARRAAGLCVSSFERMPGSERSSLETMFKTFSRR